MPDGVAENASLIIAAVACMASVAWFVARGCAAKNGACRVFYCPRCGLDIAARMSGRSAVSQARRVSTVVDAPRAAASGALPSDLLRGGWSRTVQPAADAAGRPVFSDSADARCFTLLGAMNRAFGPGSKQWDRFLRELQAVLRKRHWKVSIQKWNRAALNQEQVVAVAAEAERRMRQDGQ